MTTVSECKHCTVPTEGDTCGFCKSYVPPADAEFDAHRDQELLDQRLAHIPLPAGATTDGWLSIRSTDGDAIRSLEWSRHDTGMAAGVSVDGWQDEHGQIDRHVGLCDVPDDMTADDARRLAAALIEAANALDALQRDGR